jgi:hypothetical protein
MVKFETEVHDPKAGGWTAGKRININRQFTIFIILPRLRPDGEHNLRWNINVVIEITNLGFESYITKAS